MAATSDLGEPHTSPVHYDLTNASADDLARFVFDHAVADATDEQPRTEWYWVVELEISIDPSRQLELAAALFANSAALRETYSVEQLEQGL